MFHGLSPIALRAPPHAHPRFFPAAALASGLVLAALTAGCDSADDDDGPFDAPPTAAAVFAPGVISDTLEQWRVTFTPDGRTAYFAASTEFFPFTRQATIFVTHYEDGAWTEPDTASFSGRYSDIDPFVSPDGRRLYFSSIRPVGGVEREDIDLWMVEKTGSGWGAPVHLGDGVNRPDADELYPSVDAAGTLYFASGPFFPQPGKHFDIYRAERSGSDFGARVALGSGVNTAPVAGGGLQDAWEFNPEVTADGKTLVFTSLRPGGRGLGDLYVSRYEGGAWTAARNLGPTVNTAADEYHPTLTRDRRVLLFVRRGDGDGDFFHLATGALDL